MIEDSIAIIANHLWKNSIDNINSILSDGQIGSFNMNDYYYLTVIYELNNPKFSEIAEALHLTKPSISAMVKRLTESGLVNKVQSEEDKRVFFVTLTEKGLKIVQGDYTLYKNMAEWISKMLTKDQISEAECLLKLLADSLTGKQP